MLLVFLLTVAPPTSEPASLRDVLATLRTMDTIDGCAVGMAAWPGDFFQAASRVLKLARIDDYQEMLGDVHPVVRVMGALGILLQHPEAMSMTTPLLADISPLDWNPYGCIVDQRNVGFIVASLRSNPSALGLTKSGGMGPPCGQASATD